MRLLPPLEVSAADIIREVEAEMDEHIRERADRLQESGTAPERALEEAADRFGDRNHYLLESAAIVMASRVAAAHRRRSRRMALIAAGLAVIVSVGAAGLVAAQRVGHIQQSLATAQIELQTFRGGGGGLPLAQEVRFVTVRGKVEHPRVWTLPRATHVTLREIVQKSGGLAPGATGQARITRYADGLASQDIVLGRKDWDTPHGDVELNGFATIELQ